MSAAAFQADYVDMRFVKSRKVAQIVVEIPIERAAEYIAAFGAPNPAEGVPVAIARLVAAKSEQKPANGKDRRKWTDMPAAQQAALRCNEPGFLKFLERDFGPCPDSEAAATAVRFHCNVKSRSELNTNAEAAALWKKLDDSYYFWARGIE